MVNELKMELCHNLHNVIRYHITICKTCPGYVRQCECTLKYFSALMSFDTGRLLRVTLIDCCLLAGENEIIILLWPSFF